MILDDYDEVIIDDHLIVISNKSQLVAIFILVLISLEVLEHRGSREIIGYPMGGRARFLL